MQKSGQTLAQNALGALVAGGMASRPGSGQILWFVEGRAVEERFASSLPRHGQENVQSAT